jgi:ABC-type Zn uptake system ZnuABC Zn-binding protein ZnuA
MQSKAKPNTAPARWLVVLTMLLLLSACVAPAGAPAPVAAPEAQEGETDHNELPKLMPVNLGAGDKLRVVATLNILSDIVQNVGGDWIELTTLLPVGADPHTYSAAPADLRSLSDAHVIFVVGEGVEESMLAVLENREGDSALVAVNHGIELMTVTEEDHEEDETEEHHHGDGDPHTWTAIPNVIEWVESIEHTLSALDPANAAAYAAAAVAYTDQLEALEQEIQAAVATIPLERRKLVTDHDVFGYFAAHYGFTVVGSVAPALSTLAEPSAQELAALQDQIKAEGAPAIFVGTTVNPALEEQIARDLGIQVVALYTESLSAPDGPAPTYLEFMRYNVDAIVDALK